MGGGGGGRRGGGGLRKFFFNESNFKINSGGKGGRGRVWLGYRVIFFFSSPPKKNFFLEGMKVREDWLV